MKNFKRIIAMSIVFIMLFSNIAMANWVKSGNDWYYTDSSGMKRTGWITVGNNQWYFMNTDGKMKTGWYQDGSGNWFYLNKPIDGVEGQMKVGWFKDTNGKWYFLNTVLGSELGKMIKNQWLWIDGYCYYFGLDGAMFSNTKTPDGYDVNVDGRYMINGVVVYERGKGISSNIRNNEKRFSGTLRSGGGSSKIMDTTLTREKWISYLIEKSGVDTSQIKFINDYFRDVDRNTVDGKNVLLANELGILPKGDADIIQDFKGNEPATREFAALTAMNLMKYEESNSLPIEIGFCEDEAGLTYKFQAFVAIKFGYMSLKNGNCFAGSDALTTREAEQILSKIQEIWQADANLGINAHQIIEYNDLALVEPLQNEKVYNITDIGNQRYRIEIAKNENTVLIEIGKPFLLPARNEIETEYPFKAEYIHEENGIFVIEAIAAKPEEVYQRIDGEGRSSRIIVSDIELKEGVTGAYVDSNGNNIALDDTITSQSVEDKISKFNNLNRVATPSSSARMYLATDSNTSLSDTELESDRIISAESREISVGKLVFNVDVELEENVKVFGKVSLEPKVIYDVDMRMGIDGIHLNELTLSLEKKLEMESGFSLTGNFIDGNRGGLKQKELARVPVSIAPSLSVDFVVSFIIEASGEVKVTYTLEDVGGIQYKDGVLRQISNTKNNDYNVKSLSGSVKVGIKFAVNLTVNALLIRKDIIGIAVETGLGFEVAMTRQHTRMTCFEANVYLFLQIGLNSDTALAEITGIGITWEIFNAENSPLKGVVHFELENSRFRKVEECTYGNGKIEGKIIDAETKNPIRNARVIVKKDGVLKRTVYTNHLGEYRVDKLSEGKYHFSVTADEYNTFKIEQIDVTSNDVTIMQDVKMLKRGSTNVATVRGNFLNSDTIEKVSNVTYEVYRGWNTRDIEPIISGMANGNYEFQIVPGNYTIRTKAEGYLESFEIFTARSNGNHTVDLILVPMNNDGTVLNGDLKVVLRWGEIPYDLDSHLFGPKSHGGYFHVFFQDKQYYENRRIADLDIDDTMSYGPETTTLYQQKNDGKYSFFVHDFTNRMSLDSKDMSNSGAYIKVYTRNGNRVIHIPTNRSGTVWHAFDYDVHTGRITVPNRFFHSSNPSTLDVRLADIDSDLTVNEMINEISYGSMLEK